MADENKTVTLEICGTCGILMPQILWSGAKIISMPCAHRNLKMVTFMQISESERGDGAQRSPSQQVAVFGRCMRIYAERSKVRGELWAEFDVHDALHNVRSKLARAKAAIDGDISQPQNMSEALDSLYDMINYAAFALRHLTGEKPYRNPGV